MASRQIKIEWYCGELYYRILHPCQCAIGRVPCGVIVHLRRQQVSAHAHRGGAMLRVVPELVAHRCIPGGARGGDRVQGGVVRCFCQQVVGVRALAEDRFAAHHRAGPGHALHRVVGVGHFLPARVRDTGHRAFVRIGHCRDRLAPGVCLRRHIVLIRGIGRASGDDLRARAVPRLAGQRVALGVVGTLRDHPQWTCRFLQQVLLPLRVRAAPVKDYFFTYTVAL